MDAPSEKVNSEAAESMSTDEKTDERETQHCCPSDEGSAKSDCGEGPAVEGLLLLQHVSGTASTELPPSKRQMMPDDTSERSKASEPEIDCTTVNPIHQLLKTRNMMRAKDEVELLGRFRGVFALSKLSVYYSIIQTANHFHFLGFHHSAAAAAQAWDLASLKRAMSNSQNLSTARTNFRLEDYGRLERVLSLMVVLRFDELVDMFRDLHPDLGAVDEMQEVQNTIESCKMSFEDELGNVTVPADARDNRRSVQTQTCSADEMKDIVASSCKGPPTQNSWVKNIRDSKKWKGVYFSRDGVPYSKVEFGGKYHYLGRFDTLEGAARAYDLATLKRAMMNRQSIVSLNFPKDDYIQDRQLMTFLYCADSEQVSSFIRMMAHNQRACSVGDHYGRGRSASKRQKLDGPTTMAAFKSWGRKPADCFLQRIDWEELGLDKEKAPAHDQPIRHNNEQSAEGEENDDMDVEEETSDPVKRQEMKVERRICDPNMAALLRDSRDWVQVALNAVALRMTHANITVATEHVLLPSTVAEWFGASSNNVEGPRAVELSNACGKQTFRFICSVAKDHCQFSATVWNQFVDEIGLTVGDILVLLKSNALWKLSYAVFILPDAVVADSFSQSIPLGGGPQKLPKIPASMYIPPAAAIRPSPAPSPAPPARRILHANVLSDAQHLTEIKILQKTQDGRLLVEAGLIRDPVSGFPADQRIRGLFVIPANAVHAAPMIRTSAGFVALHGQPFQTPGNKRHVFGTPPPPSQYIHSTNPRQHRVQRPACLPSVPIRLNIRGGVNALAKKTDRGLYMVTDAHGQVRLVTSQAPTQHPAGRGTNHLQPVNYSHPSEAEPAVGYPCQVFPNESQRNARSAAATADRISHTSPDITVIDPSTTGSDASGTGTEKPLTHPAQQEEHSSQKNVIDLVEEDEKEPDSEKQGDNLPDMYTHITKIIEECQTIDADTAKKYKFAFVNKMTLGQQTANFMELKNLCQAGDWSEVAEWIKKTVDSLS